MWEQSIFPAPFIYRMDCPFPIAYSSMTLTCDRSHTTSLIRGRQFLLQCECLCEGTVGPQAVSAVHFGKSSQTCPRQPCRTAGPASPCPRPSPCCLQGPRCTWGPREPSSCQRPRPGDGNGSDGPSFFVSFLKFLSFPMSLLETSLYLPFKSITKGLPTPNGECSLPHDFCQLSLSVLMVEVTLTLTPPQ